MTTNIIITLQFEGFHNWGTIPREHQEQYLKNLHRHIFHVTCKKSVEHHDRHIEFIQFKREIQNYCNSYLSTKRDIGNMSCEMIAQQLIVKFDLNYCKVMEDNENGAEVIV